MSEILINRVANDFHLDKTEAMIFIERQMMNGQLDELLLITGLDGVCDV